MSDRATNPAKSSAEPVELAERQLDEAAGGGIIVEEKAVKLTGNPLATRGTQLLGIRVGAVGPCN